MSPASISLLLALSAPVVAELPPAEAAPLPAAVVPAAEAEPAAEALRARRQVALKAVWLERLIRAREERHRVTRENLSRCAALAQKLGAPAEFVGMLRCQSQGNLSARDRHALESAQQALLAEYGIAAREMRFFVEGSGLSPEELRDVAAWLPLADVFNAPLPGGLPGAGGEGAGELPASLSPEQAEADCAEMLQLQRQLISAMQGAVDRGTADAAADALCPVALRFLALQRRLMSLPEGAVTAAFAACAEQFNRESADYARERLRLQKQGFYGSHRLRVVDYLLP